MAIPLEYRDLMQQLLDATRDRRVRWRDHDNGVIVWFGSQGLHLWSGADDMETAFVGVGLMVRDSAGKIRMEDRFFIELSKEGRPYFDLLETAERQAKGLDLRLGAIKAAIKKAAAEGGLIGDPDPDIPF
jgi:hypothetical protein